jgi:hypothetical protein
MLFFAVWGVLCGGVSVGWSGVGLDFDVVGGGVVGGV